MKLVLTLIDRGNRTIDISCFDNAWRANETILASDVPVAVTLKSAAAPVGDLTSWGTVSFPKAGWHRTRKPETREGEISANGKA